VHEQQKPLPQHAMDCYATSGLLVLTLSMMTCAWRATRMSTCTGMPEG